MAEPQHFDNVSDEGGTLQPLAMASGLTVQHSSQEQEAGEASRLACTTIATYVFLAFARFLYRAAGTLSSMAVYYFTTWSSLQFLADKMGVGDSPVAKDVIFTWMTIWTVNFVLFATINGMASKQSKSGSITSLIKATDVRLAQEVRDQPPAKKVMALFVWVVFCLHRIYLAAGVTRTILSMLSTLTSEDGMPNVGEDTTTPAYVPPPNNARTWGVSITLIVTVFVYVQTMCLWSGPSLVDKLLSFLYRWVACCEKKKRDEQTGEEGIELVSFGEEGEEDEYVALPPPAEKAPQTPACLDKLAQLERRLNDTGYQHRVINDAQASHAAMGCLLVLRWVERVIVIISEVFDYAGSVGTLLDEVFTLLGVDGDEADRLGLGIAFFCSAVTVVVTTFFIIHCQEPIPPTRHAGGVLCGLWWANQQPTKRKATGQEAITVYPAVKVLSACVAIVFALTRGCKVFFKAWILLDQGTGSGDAHLGEGWVPDGLADVLAWMYLSVGGVITLSVAHGFLTVLAKAVTSYEDLNRAIMNARCMRPSSHEEVHETAPPSRVVTDGVELFGPGVRV